jgi:hypothetical protein
MAVDSSALTLPQYAMMSNDPLVRRITYSLLAAGSVLTDIPLVNRKTLIANGVRFEGDSLPDVNWEQINGEPVTVTATPKAYQAQAYMIRNQIDTDKRLVEDENAIQDPRGVRLEAYLRAVAYDFNNIFINNTHTAGDVNAPVGLRARLDNPTLYGCESELKIDGGAVDMTTAMTATTANNFIELVDTLLSYLGAPDGNGVVIYMNDTLHRRFARAIRILGAGSGFATDRDAFDRTVETYKGAVVRDIGRKKDQSTRIITTTEDTSGVDGASTYTSLYAVRYGEEGLFGWQFEDLSSAVRDLGLLNNGVTYRTVIDWAVGLYQAHTRAVGRIFEIKLA